MMDEVSDAVGRLLGLERDGTISVLPADERAQVVDVSVEQGVQTVRVEIG